MVSVEDLQRFDLFRTLPGGVLERLAERTERVHFPASAPILRQGEVGDYFYIIWFGHVAVYRELETGERRLLNKLGEGEFFGEEALLSPENRRNATVEAQTPVDVLRFDRGTFLELWRDYLEWRNMVSDTTRLRAQFGIDFPELEPDEVGLVLVRRHPYAFIEAILPVMVRGGLAFIVIFLFIFLATSIQMSATTSFLIGAIPAIVTVGVSVWIYMDWRNDLFIVTSKRVLHIERVLGYSENRIFAPIGQVRTVTTTSPTLWARLLGYKDLSIQTGTTVETIVFTSVENADQIGTKIEKARDKAVSQLEREGQRGIELRLRQRLNLPPTTTPDLTGAVQRTDQETSTEERRSRIWEAVRYIIPPLRSRQGNKTVWRRHWYILVRKIAGPGFFLLILIGLTVWLISDPIMAATLELSWAQAILISLWGIVLFGLAWQYADWHNDYYSANHSEIINRHSLPFGFREKRTMITFESVQGVRVDVPGPGYKLLNIGHVHLETIGGADPITFDSVGDPFGIQREIFDRLEAYRTRRERERVVQRGEELGDWFAIYRESVEQSQPQVSPLLPDGETASQPPSGS